jgi:hypothetical protein
VLMGQASGPRTPPEVRAKSFVLVDANGETRARLYMSASANGPGLTLYDASGKSRAMLAAAPDGPGLVLGDANGKLRAELGVTSNGPGLQLNDASGFETDIGVTDLITPANGETHTTSAASIVLFGKDKKVLWSAPPQN